MLTNSTLLPSDAKTPVAAGDLGSKTPVLNGTATTTTAVVATNNQDINGLLSGTRWSNVNLTFGFPTLASQYFNYVAGDEQDHGFAPLNATMMTAARGIFAQYTAITGLTLTENAAAPGNATIRLAFSSDASPTAYAYYPSSGYWGGDVWFGTQTGGSNMSNPVKGNYAYHSMMHEIGHALGLKHGQEVAGPGNTPMTAAHDSMEFSIMTYRSYEGDPLSGGYSNETYGYAQSLMMYDIAALQYMYGADFTMNATNSVYTFSKTTGEMFINGVSQGGAGWQSYFPHHLGWWRHGHV